MTTLKPNLFDQFERTDGSPAGYREDAFSFRNRVDQPYWDEVRAELERWYAAFPDEPPYPLRKRFRDVDPAQHFGAWWELYLHHVFECLGFEVTVEPELGSGYPDFRMSRDSRSFLLEATTCFSGIVDDERRPAQEAAIFDAINQVRNLSFQLSVNIEAVGFEQPPVRSVVDPIEEWLGRLNPDEVEEFDEELVVETRGWRIRLGALPRAPESRGDPEHQIIGIGQMIVGYSNDRDRLSSALRRKGKIYRPDEPFVIAVLTMSSGTMDLEDVAGALLGPTTYPIDPERPGLGAPFRERDGYWMRRGGPTRTRVSAVLVGNNLVPEKVANTWPRLWPNPWAAHRLEADLPFPMGSADERGAVHYSEVECNPNELLGLPQGWPGPERDAFTKGWSRLN